MVSYTPNIKNSSCPLCTLSGPHLRCNMFTFSSSLCVKRLIQGCNASYSYLFKLAHPTLNFPFGTILKLSCHLHDTPTMAQPAHALLENWSLQTAYHRQFNMNQRWWVITTSSRVGGRSGRWTRWWCSLSLPVRVTNRWWCLANASLPVRNILKQPSGNDHCGFYVMHYMQNP